MRKVSYSFQKVHSFSRRCIDFPEYVLSMVCLCRVYVLSMFCMCYVYGVSMFCLCFVYVLSVFCLCCVDGLSMLCQCHVYVVSMFQKVHYISESALIMRKVHSFSRKCVN